MIHPWLPIATFGSIAAVYLFLNFAVGAHLSVAVQLIALASLFAATPICAFVCRRIALPLRRLIAVFASAATCAALWTLLITAYFSSGVDTGHESLSHILLCGIPSTLMYAPLIWLASGGADAATKADSTANPAALSDIAKSSTIVWLLIAGALATALAWQLDIANWWGPMSLFTGPVAGVLSAINVIRDSRSAGAAVRWTIFTIAVVLILRMLYFATYILFVSGMLH